MKLDFDKTRLGIQRRAFDIGAEEDDEEKKDEEEERADDEEEKEDEEAAGELEAIGDEAGAEPAEEDEPPAEEDEEEAPAEDAEDGGGGAADEEDEDKKDERFIVEGYAATFNSPYLLMRGNGASLFERVDSHAFDRAEMRDVILQYDHGGRVFARQSNGTLELSIDARGLKVRANLSGTDEGRKLYREIKGGYTTKMSLSFTIDEEDTEETPEEEIIGFRTGSPDRYYLRTIRKIGRVYDVSAVSLPANEGTEILARNKDFISRERERLSLEIELALAM